MDSYNKYKKGFDTDEVIVEIQKRKDTNNRSNKIENKYNFA